MDWDNTLRPGFTIVDWAQFLVDRELFEARALNGMVAAVQDYRTGMMSYPELSDLVPRLYAEGLSGQVVRNVARVAPDFVEQDRKSLFDFAEPLHLFLQKRGIDVVVVSGAPIEVLRTYQHVFGWSAVYGVTVRDEAGSYLPALAENPAGAPAKKAIVRTISPAGAIVLALGDSGSDAPLLNAAACKVVVDSDGIIADGPGVMRINSKVAPDRLVSSLVALLGKIR